jgi:sulfur carrier protein ThiS
MTIVVNFVTETLPENSLSITEIMKRHRYTFPHIITMLNGKPVSREARETTFAVDGDKVEFFHMVGGG